MRIGKFVSVVCVCLALSACASVLIGSKTQSLMMKALFKPLIGFDPTQVKLLENPMIKGRMQNLLGDKYAPTMQLLNTAQEIQREGALFYIASRYAPAQVQQITDKAAMVWNSDTNQMAVLLIKDGAPEIFSEQIAGAKEKLVPSLPNELQNAYDQAKAVQDAATNARQNLINKITEAVDKQLGIDGQQLDTLKSKAAAEETVQQKIIEQTRP